MIREGLPPRSARCHPVSVDCVRLVAWCGYQREDGEGRLGTKVQLDDRQGVVGGELTRHLSSTH